MNFRAHQIKILLFLVSLILNFHPLYTYSQGKEAYVWMFGEEAGIDFNTGSPPSVISSPFIAHAGFPASICDTNGSLLFFSDGRDVWNRNHDLMLNSSWPLTGSYAMSCIVVPKPESSNLYYYFNFLSMGTPHNFIYSLIDMDLDNGLGGISFAEKDVFLIDHTNSRCLTAVKHANGTDIWVITHDRRENHPNSHKYYAFLVTANGITPTPVTSVTEMSITGLGAFIRISPDGKKLVAISPNNGAYFNLLDFNTETGVVSDTNQIVHYVSSINNGEFSSDNSKLYIDANPLVQYDLHAGSNEEIINSEVAIGETSSGMQLGPDGKIYLMQSDYLNVIHYPNEKGEACGFESEYVPIEYPQFGYGDFPIFIQSYLNDPTFSAQNLCLGDVTTFEIDDTNGIDSVFWRFNDFPQMPHDTSTLFNPTYTFSYAGTFQVDLTVYSGLLEKSIHQEVVIFPIPNPNLGPNTLFCDTEFGITLNPHCDGALRWSDFSTGTELFVSDTGTYWVRATNNGCSQADSIYIGLYSAPVLDESGLIITDTECGQPNGAITGLQVNGTQPLNYYWTDMAGDTVGLALDLTGQYASSYELNVTDGNGCNHQLASYTITDNGSLQIDSVQSINTHCDQPIGTITIYADSPTPGLLDYSIDGGDNHYQNGGVFVGLSSGIYHVTVKDGNGCVGIYSQNPVVIENIPGPQITSVDIVPEDNLLVNGSIYIHAYGGSGDLTYSIGNGILDQINNGQFINLSAGNYNCLVTDAFGCDTTFNVYVPLVITQTLEAIAGLGTSCVEDAVLVPLEVVNFTQVSSFVVTLYYNPNIVMCDGYLELNPQLELGSFQATVLQATGEIKLNWTGPLSVTLPDRSKMLQLKYDGLGEGFSPIDWEGVSGESHFYDENQQEISASYTPGEVKVFSLPQIQMLSAQQICAGEAITIDPTILGGNGQKNYDWTGPNGYRSDDTLVSFASTTTNQAGSYNLLITDSMNCNRSQSMDLIVMPSPNIAFSGYDTLFVTSGYLLDAGSDAQSYWWNTGETTEQITIDTAGLYSVEVYSDQGCKASDAVMILWAGKSFYIPNAFTPNGDGLNDVFGAIPRIDYVNQYRLSIYNRWGQLLFETTNLDQGWDGTYQGKASQAGAYVYRIVYNEFGMGIQETKVKEGTVVLIR